jgi:hypothetical protein
MTMVINIRFRKSIVVNGYRFPILAVIIECFFLAITGGILTIDRLMEGPLQPEQQPHMVSVVIGKKAYKRQDL